MTTKAEASLYRQQRSGPKKGKLARHKLRKSPKGGGPAPAEDFLNRRDRSKKSARKIHERVRAAVGFPTKR